ncbi:MULTISPECIES: PPC domain-containing DNA-binding protein [Dethiosulfovibrio]|jgi:hypothetical protein|uniref:DNA-binding protein n=2 Tax=Dethiosulfovibrio TaxID=47054 RepID=A0ABS9EQQ2_9BACT|nr:MULTISPECIES: PPC domain-containing DNA-binding protein [Dethiosulfovibrio]MCF4115068.1 DNA-binding protein [Dethiosulfovibrio russensis]MCF4143490.1 DNA-binding protein [Dethiosulfovibrio marinus]MCF4145695.1 DNA-binding protein [Dethiosulfovibrio acidaminovorans]MEA3284172.1 PPC domain-containing DNA-binding protein [Synergistota bacterium]
MGTFEAATPRGARRIAVRITPGSDLFQGIRDVCRHFGITCASVESALGSLASATVVCISDDSESPSGASYKDPTHIEAPMELVALCGTVGAMDGETSIHLHGTVALDEKTPYCGHLVDDGKNTVLATVEMQIVELIGMNWVRRHDPETGFTLFKPEDSRYPDIGEPGR